MANSVRRAWVLGGLAAWLALAWSPRLKADTNGLTYQGRFTNADGSPVAGPVDLKILFYRDAASDTPIAIPPITVNAVPLDDGIFTVPLTFQSTADSSMVFPDVATPVFVEVTDTTHNVTYARQRLSVMPFALRVPVDGQTIVFNPQGQLSVGPESQPGPGQFLTKDANGAFSWSTPSTLGGEPLSLPASPTAGQVLEYDGTRWSATSVPTITTQASATANGYLSSSDWRAFNSRAAYGAAGGAPANSVFVDATGRVGIGTATPSSKLTVSDPSTGVVTPETLVSAPGNGAGNYMILALDNHSSSSFKSAVQFMSNGVNRYSFGTDFAGNGTNNFYIYDNVASTARLLIDNTGNVGIGTTAPTVPLEVSTGFLPVTPGWAQLAVADNQWNVAAVGVSTFNGTTATAARFYASAQNGTWGLIGTGTTAQFTISNNGAERVRIDTAGDVGIGSTTPAAALDVAGTVKLGAGGVAFTASGACTIASTTISTSPANYTCTGVPASVAVAVWCSPQAALTGAGTASLCRATGTGDQIACNTTTANAVTTPWSCLWIQQ